jgi:hypothetical protein
MDQQPAFTFQDLFAFVIGDMAKAIAERDGETREQQFARCQAGAHMILGFLPRDVIEAMLAGHCVMLHEVMTADVRTALRGDASKMPRGPRNNVIGLNKAFNDNLDRLEHYRQRPAEASHAAHEAPAIATPGSASSSPPETTEPQQPVPAAQGLNRAARRQAARAEMRAGATGSRTAPPPTPVTSAAQTINPGKTSPDTAVIAGLCSPSPAAGAAGNANPEAIAALRSGDPVGFARAMGIEDPCEAFLTAANTKGSPFDPSSSGPWPIRTIVPAPKV